MLRYLANVVTLELDEKVCNGCGMCVTVCPHRVFEVANRAATDGNGSCQDCGACLDSDDCLFETSSRKAAIIDRDACIECGACALNCPVDAIRVQTGTGCAVGILLGAVGCGNECSGDSGCAPSGETDTEDSCGCATGTISCCGSAETSCSGSEASPVEANRR